MAIDRQPSRPIVVLEAGAWLAALRDPRHPIDLTAAFLGTVAGDWTTAPRISPQYVVHYLFCAPRGRLAVRLADGVLEPPPGALLWFPPGLPFELALHSRRRRETLLRLRFQLRRGERILSPFDRPRVVPRPDGYAAIARELEGEWQVERPHRDGAVRALLARIAIMALRAEEEVTGHHLTSAQLERITGWVGERLADRPEPAELARVVGLSLTHFTRCFTATVGCPPRSWLVHQRIQHAAERLRTSGCPIAAVAAEFGYDNPFLFSRQFSAVMGRSPRAWRRGG